MLGRSSRSQGKPEGLLVMFDEPNIDITIALNKIKSRDVAYPTYGFKNLELLAKHKTEIRNSVLGEIKTVYSSD
jgi:hypothetical protein